jgi:hypothetical protein
MRRHPFMIAMGIVSLAALAAAAQPAQEAGKSPQKVLITGFIDGEGLDKLVPKGNFITNQADFKSLWKQWLLMDDAPEVDFKKDFVVVAVTRFGPIKNMVLLDRSGDGDMGIQMALEKNEGSKGFYTMLAVYPRSGIKSIKGVPIAPK